MLTNDIVSLEQQIPDVLIHLKTLVTFQKNPLVVGGGGVLGHHVIFIIEEIVILEKLYIEGAQEAV